MAEVQQLRVQEAVDAMVKSVERENIRKMQGLMFRCSANCCEDTQASMQQVHQCIERCHAPLAQAQALVTSELERFQGAYFAWKATAMGKNYVNGKTFLEKRYNEDLELEDAIHTAILTLKESFEGQMTEDNIEVGICNEAGFRRLTPTEVRDYLAAIA